MIGQNTYILRRKILTPMPGNQKLFGKIARMLKKRGAIKVAVFGSYARGDQGPDSDLDIMVEFSERKSLLDIIGIEQELSDKLGLKVDLLTEKAISPYLIDRIRKEMVVIAG
jgi:predicted nucleotidyltransferase